MAYKRFARRRVRRRMGRRRLGAKVKRIAKIVNRTKPTVKVFDDNLLTYCSYNGNPAADPNGSTCSFAPTTGTGYSNRQNPIVHLHKIKMIARFNTSLTNEVVRLQGFVLRDRYESGVNVTNLYNPSAGGSNAPIGHPDPVHLCPQKYTMIYDSGPRCIGTSGGLHSNLVVRKTLNMKGMKVDFGGLTSGNPVQNIVYWVAWSGEVPGAGPTYITNTTVGITWQHIFTG